MGSNPGHDELGVYRPSVSDLNKKIKARVVILHSFPQIIKVHRWSYYILPQITKIIKVHLWSCYIVHSDNQNAWAVILHPIPLK